MPRALLLLALAIGATAMLQAGQPAAAAVAHTPIAVLTPAPAITLPGTVDSNSPAVWEADGGRSLLHVITSALAPSVATGTSLQTLGAPREAPIVPAPIGFDWIEAVVRDENGVWYGYYHNERDAALLCRGSALKISQIGAARSTNRGASWTDLGIILEAPRGSQSCSTKSNSFVGGVGDFSVQLDAEAGWLYLFYSAYPRRLAWQGVALARFPWADRDRPMGKVTVWSEGRWLSVLPSPFRSEEAVAPGWLFPPAAPFLPATRSLHSADGVVDLFWGPSVHWNTYLRQYVMLVSRAKDSDFTAEGIYVSYAPRLDDPRLWSTPVRILAGGEWYPQVVGIEPGSGTDKVAGRTARFFMHGESTRLITFSQ